MLITSVKPLLSVITSYDGGGVAVDGCEVAAATAAVVVVVVMVDKGMDVLVVVVAVVEIFDKGLSFDPDVLAVMPIEAAGSSRIPAGRYFGSRRPICNHY